MAEEIRPSHDVAAGWIDTSLAGPTGVDGLAGLLEGLSKAVGTGVEIWQERERAAVESKLSNPFLTPQEAQEIEKDANFPTSKLLARNRRGMAVAEQWRPQVEAALADSKDPIEARDVLAKFQQQASEGINDASVLAGIHEHFAAFAPRLLAEASKRREINQDLEERQNTNIILSTAAQKGGSYFSEVLAGLASDDHLVNRDKVPQLHSDAADALLNRYAENPDSAGEIFKAVDQITKTPGLFTTEGEKQNYFRVRDAIRKVESKRNDDAGSEKARKAIHRQAELEVMGYLDRGQPVPDEVMGRYTSTADSAITAANKIKTYKKSNNIDGIFGESAYERGKALIRASAKKDVFGNSDVGRQLAIYDELAGAINPAILDGPPEKAEAMIQELARRSRDLADKQEALIKEREQKLEEMQVRAFTNKAKALEVGNQKALKDIEDFQKQIKYQQENRVLLREQVRNQLYQQAEAYGIDIRDDLIDHY